MVYENIIVRADFVNGQVVPLCFQTTRNAPCHTIGRVVLTTSAPEKNTTLYNCRMAKSDANVTLALKNEANTLSWSATADWDLTKPISKTDNEQATDLPVEKPKNSETEMFKDERDINDILKIDGVLTAIYGFLFAVTRLWIKMPDNPDFMDKLVWNGVFVIFIICAAEGLIALAVKARWYWKKKKGRVRVK